MTRHSGDIPSVSDIHAHVEYLGYASSEHARASLKSISSQLWLSVAIAFLILAPLQWFLLR
jgi:hypothetical protein